MKSTKIDKGLKLYEHNGYTLLISDLAVSDFKNMYGINVIDHVTKVINLLPVSEKEQRITVQLSRDASEDFSMISHTIKIKKMT